MRRHHLARLQAAFDAEGQRREQQLRAGQPPAEPAPPLPVLDRVLIGVTGLLGVTLLARALWG